MKSQRQDVSIPQNSQIQRTLLTHLRHEFSTPMNAIIGYSEMLLEELEAQPDLDLFSNLQKIHICGVQLLTANVILDPAQVGINQPGWDIDTFDSIIRLELLTPLSNIVGYCEMLLEEAPAELIPDINRIHAASQHSLSMINDIVNLAARLTTAAMQVEAKSFNPDSLADLALRTDKLGQLGRLFQHMASEVNSREQRLEQQVHMLDVVINEVQKKRMMVDIAETDHFRQLQKRARGQRQAGKAEQQRQNVHTGSLAKKSFPAPHLATSSPQIISVHSFRGGTGKSNLTSNLVTMIASQGRRVGIVDMDIQSPDIHMLFGLDEETIHWTLNDYLWGRCAISEAAYDVSHVLLRQQTSTASGSIYLIPSSIKTNNMTRILREGYDEEMLRDGLQELIRALQLDYLFIDTHPGINEETLQSITISSLVIMILRPDYQDYQGTAVTVELARMLAASQMLLVVNKALSILDPESFRQQLEAAYNVPVAGMLPLCEEMANLASSDIFGLCYPNHPWTKAVHAVAKQIFM